MFRWGLVCGVYGLGFWRCLGTQHAWVRVSGEACVKNPYALTLLVCLYCLRVWGLELHEHLWRAKAQVFDCSTVPREMVGTAMT